MKRIGGIVSSVVVLILLSAGCVGESSTALSDPAVLPGVVGAEATLAVADAEVGDVAAGDAGTAAGEVDAVEADADAADADADAVPVDLAFVQRSLDRTAQQSYRFEVRFAMSIDAAGGSMAVSPEAPFATGESDGYRERTLVDLGAMLEGFAAELGDEMGADMDDLTGLLGVELGMETVVDGTDIYLRAPMFAAFADYGDEWSAGLAALGDGWGRIDGTKVPGIAAADVAGLAGAQGGSTPDQILMLLEELGSLRVIGPATVDGDATTLYRTVVDIEAALAAEVPEFEALGDAAAEEIAAMFGDGPVIDLYIDAAGNLRRLSMAITGDDPSGGGSFAVSTTVDMFDHGVDISIGIPDGAVDLTEVFAELAARGDGSI